MSDDDLTGGKDFLSGYLNIPGSEYQRRSPGGQAQYHLGRSLAGQNKESGNVGVRPVTEADRQQALALLRTSLRLGLVGAVIGLGYGIWQVLGVGALTGGGPAMTVLTWTGIGAAVGALLPVGLIVGVGVGLLVAILFGLGLLLNFLTGL